MERVLARTESLSNNKNADLELTHLQAKCIFVGTSDRRPIRLDMRLYELKGEGRSTRRDRMRVGLIEEHCPQEEKLHSWGSDEVLTDGKASSTALAGMEWIGKRFAKPSLRS